MMSRTLGRDRIWDQATWDEIDRAVKDEMDRVRVVRRVFPVLHPSPDPAGTTVIHAGQVTDQLTIREDQTKLLVEMSVGFSLTPAQVETERDARTARTLVRLAAKFLALAEDSLLLHGEDSTFLARNAGRVNVPHKEYAEKGLVRATKQTIPVEKGTATTPGGVYGEKTFEAVTLALAALITQGQPGPYALFLPTVIYADIHAPLSGTLSTTADRMRPLLEKGIHPTGALQPEVGLLVSLAGASTAIYVAQEAVTAYLHENEDGDHRFKVYERVQFVARDPSSLVRLEFEGPAIQLTGWPAWAGLSAVPTTP
jgi:uncharacterized linocin/CFP29 family protein